jgi:uncharacterized membrane protein YfcA
VLLLAYWVRGMAGFGSGLMAVPLVVALDYIGSASQGIRNVDEVSWREQLVLIPFMVIGVGLGLWVLRAVSTALLAKVLGGFVIAYALYVIYLNLRGLARPAFRATFAMNFLIDGRVRLGAFAAAGLFGRQTLGYLLAALPIAGAGLYVGGRIRTGFSQRAFQIVIRLLLLVSGVALLLKR